MSRYRLRRNHSSFAVCFYCHRRYVIRWSFGDHGQFSRWVCPWHTHRFFREQREAQS